MSTESLIAFARRILAAKGQPVVFQYETGGDVDPATGAVTTPPTPQSVAGNGYPSRYKTADVDGQQVLRTDTRLIVEQVATLPKKGWRCVVNGLALRVMDVQRITQGGVDIIYICQLRAM